MQQGSEEWFDEYEEEYRDFLKRWLQKWHDIKENGDPIWRAEWKNGQPVLVMKEVQE